MKLSLEPAFKRSIAYNFTDDAHIEDIFMDHGKKYEFADVTWYPSRHTAVYRYDYRVPLNTSGNGEYDFLGFQPNSILVSKTTRSSGAVSFSSVSNCILLVKYMPNRIQLMDVKKCREITGECA